MKRRIFAAVLATAMVLSLAACGGKTGGGSSSSNSGGGSDVSAIGPGGSSSDGSAPDGSQPDASAPDASNPDGSQPDASNPGGGSNSAVSITLNKTDVTLKKAGSTFKLRYTAQPDTDGIPSFISDKPEIAAVDESGTVTAVAPGTATITVTYDGAQASCVVRCKWDAPADSSGSSGGSSSSSSSSSQVDLQKFYDDTIGKYEFGFLELADSSILDQLYSGLSGISAEQKLVYITMMSMNNGEFGLVQVKDAKDVDAVKAIFQARIDRMTGADGQGNPGAWYPGPTEQWENNSRVVSNGNYVMMVVHENCDDIVNEFNALF